MPVVFNAATAANVNILRETNQLFQISQRRVATGKNIFSAADEATRYTMSQTMLSRSKNLDSVNSNISTALKTLESTDKTLTQIRNLLGQMNDMANRALNAGSPTTVQAVAAGAGAGVSETTQVTGGSSNAHLSITSDNGKNFTYTFNGSPVTWGQVAQALNAANIGVTMRFQANGTGSSVVLESSDNSTGFTIDGLTSQAVMTQLSGMSSPYDGTNGAAANSRFVAGTSTPSGFGGSNPEGLRFGLGGIVNSASTFAGSSVPAGSSITFLGSDGVARTWSTTAAKNLDTVLAEINSLNAGVKAEFVQTAAGQYRVSMRNLNGSAMTVLNGTGAFDSNTGLSRFNTTSGAPVVTGTPVAGSTNSATALLEGQNYESYKTEITSLITNNVTQQGRNLLTGQNVSIILNEFSANAITVSGAATSVTGNLGLITLGTNWSTSSNIQASQTQVKAAMQIINTLQAQFGTYSSFVKERYDLNQSFSSELKSLGDDLVATDVAEESAKLTALQTQQQFAVQAFSAGAANAQSLLKLLG